MRKNIYLTVAISLLLAGCCTTRKAATVHSVSEQITQTQQVEQAERETARTVEAQADTDIVITTTTDEFDTTQPTDPATGTPPLKRRATTTTQKRARTTVNTETTTAEQQQATTDTTTASRADDQQETTEESQPALSHGWRWFKMGVFSAIVLAVVVFAFRNKIKNLLKPL